MRGPTGYTDDWPEISRWVRYERAGGNCEWAGCAAKEGCPHPLTHSTVILQVAHLNHQTDDNRLENLRASCQRCHNLHDQAYRQANAQRTRNKKANARRGLLPFAEKLPERLARKERR